MIPAGEDPTSWMYLKVISGVMVEMVQFYFTQWFAYHEAIRKAAIAILFTAGLAWMGLLIFRAPADRFKSAVGAFIVIFICGILLAPSDRSNSMYMGNSSQGAPVANGAYWTYSIIGNFYSVFKSAIDSVSTANAIGVVSGQDSPRSIASAIAYDESAEKNASNFLGTPAHKIYLDYQTKCNKAVQATYNNSAGGAAASTFHSVGLLGSTHIGLLPKDISGFSSASSVFTQSFGQNADSANNALSSYHFGTTAERAIASTGALLYAGVTSSTAALYSAKKADQLKENRLFGIKNLSSIPDAHNPYDGKQGYVLPTEAFWERAASREASGDDFANVNEAFGGRMRIANSLTHSGAPLTIDQMKARAASGQDNKFYPKNCAEAFELAEAAVAAFRSSAQKNPDVNGHPVAAQLLSATAANRAGELIKQQMIADHVRMGGKAEDLDISGNFDAAANTSYALGAEVFAKYNEYMLKFKVPMTITTCAMLAAALLVLFPVFCLMAVFMGPSILWTYLKLFTLCFFVVLLNDLFLGMAADVIAAGKLQAAGDGGFMPHGGSISASLSATHTKAVVFTSLTVIEIAAVKLFLWDDVKSLSGFSPGSVDSAGKGLKMAGGAATALLTLGRGGALLGKLGGSALTKVGANGGTGASISSSMSNAVSMTNNQVAQRFGNPSQQTQNQQAQMLKSFKNLSSPPKSGKPSNDSNS